MTIAPSVLNYMVGKGKTYFDRRDSDGNLTGERDLGNNPTFSATPSVETLDHYSSMRGIKLKDLSINVSADMALKFTLDEINVDNLLIGLYGDEIVYETQGDGNAGGEALTARMSKYVKLEFRKLQADSVTVTSSDGATTYIEDTDYSVDYVIGRIFTISTGNIADGQALLADYIYQQASYPKIEAMTDLEIEGFIRFVGDCSQGCDYEIDVWRAKLRVGGDINFISEEWNNIEFNIEVLEDTDDHPDSPYMDVIELSGDTAPES